MTMETINFLLNHMLTYWITVGLGTIMFKCKKSLLHQAFSQ